MLRPLKTTLHHSNSLPIPTNSRIPNLTSIKMTISSTLLHLTNFRNPFLRTLIPSVTAAFAIQAAVAVPSIFAQSERFYDLSGSLTYLSVTALSLYLPTLRARAAGKLTTAAWPSLRDAFTGNAGANGLNWRQVVLSAAVGVWALRCISSFLFFYLSLSPFPRSINLLLYSKYKQRNTNINTKKGKHRKLTTKQ